MTDSQAKIKLFKEAVKKSLSVRDLRGSKNKRPVACMRNETSGYRQNQGNRLLEVPQKNRIE